MKIDTKNIKTCFLDQLWGICISTNKLQDKNEWNLFMCRGKGKKYHYICTNVLKHIVSFILGLDFPYRFGLQQEW